MNARLIGADRAGPPAPHWTGETASDRIRERLLAPEPCLICRFGRTEMLTCIRYLDVSSSGTLLDKSWRYIRGETSPFWWDDERRVAMRDLSGFFPATDDNLARFAELMLADMPLVDILGSWLPEEERVAERIRGASRIPLGDMEPYRHANPWSAALEGMTVLVIHPFVETIRSQFARRENLFPGRKVLPEFRLETLQAVQSIAGAPTPYATWFDALEAMRDQISRIDFDVAIIGAGAYGMPLAAHVKRLGKKAVHLGGATQLLFGIRGKRWDDRPDFQHLFNDAWVRPSASEVPANHTLVERGTYW